MLKKPGLSKTQRRLHNLLLEELTIDEALRCDLARVRPRRAASMRRIAKERLSRSRAVRDRLGASHGLSIWREPSLASSDEDTEEEVLEAVSDLCNSDF